jgi:hypothetical protein
MHGRLNASELRRRLLPRSGGQGVAGSNPAVPTVFSNACRPQLGTKFAQVGTIMAGHPREWDAASVPVRVRSCP